MKPIAIIYIPEAKSWMLGDFPGKYSFFLLFIKYLTLAPVRDMILG